MEIFSLRMVGEYSKVLNVLKANCAVRIGMAEDPAQLSPMLSLYRTELVLFGYTPKVKYKKGIFEVIAAWDKDPLLVELPVAMAVAHRFLPEFEAQFHRHTAWTHRILPICPDDFRYARLAEVLKGHVARFRYLREEQKTYEGNDACYELVSKGDRVAFPWESWFLAPDEV